MKTCFKCHRELPLTDFYKHPMMGDGHLGKCKDCTRDDVTENRIKNIGRIRQYDRQRAQLPHRRASINRVAQEWIARFPARHRAHNKLNNAVRDRRIAKPDRCQRCQAMGRIEAHHADYSKPFDVEWVCKPCHYTLDELRRQSEVA